MFPIFPSSFQSFWNVIELFLKINMTIFNNETFFLKKNQDSNINSTKFDVL
jgi:hypothetical protein